mmetsp:Transcript_38533/g.96861  ORF Transcript_38533/g.96861 Transcript_38533/m.96861 type:complete len:296 (+) Transcript_38533:570-1457(+)
MLGAGVAPSWGKAASCSARSLNMENICCSQSVRPSASTSSTSSGSSSAGPPSLWFSWRSRSTPASACAAGSRVAKGGAPPPGAATSAGAAAGAAPALGDSASGRAAACLSLAGSGGEATGGVSCEAGTSGLPPLCNGSGGSAIVSISDSSASKPLESCDGCIMSGDTPRGAGTGAAFAPAGSIFGVAVRLPDLLCAAARRAFRDWAALAGTGGGPSSPLHSPSNDSRRAASTPRVRTLPDTTRLFADWNTLAAMLRMDCTTTRVEPPGTVLPRAGAACFSWTRLFCSHACTSASG